MTDHDPFSDFISHSSRDNSGGNFLGNWKKRQPPQVDVWMHTAVAPKAVWRHGFFKVETREDKDTRDVKRVVWSFNFNCHDPEEVVKKQYKTGDDGHRTTPPHSCPMCRMLDFVRAAVADGRLSPLDPVFEFRGSDDDEAIVLTAGGLYGGFPKKKADFADDEEDGITWKQFRAAGLSLQGDDAGAVWKQQAMAKLSYVFAVVDNKDVSRGVQIATEGALLGDKVKEVMAARKERLGVEEGSFAKNPCAIRWFHRPDEDEFNKKYAATDIGHNKLPYTEEIQELITENGQDAIARVNAQAQPGDVVQLRMLMEKYAVVDLPFDEFFEGHDTTEKPKDSKDKGSKRSRDEDDDEDEKPKAKTPPKTTTKPKAKSEPEFDCGDCGKPISADDKVCPHCGADCSEDEDEVDFPPKEEPKTKPKAETQKPKAETAKSKKDDDPKPLAKRRVNF